MSHKTYIDPIEQQLNTNQNSTYLFGLAVERAFLATPVVEIGS